MIRSVLRFALLIVLALVLLGCDRPGRLTQLQTPVAREIRADPIANLPSNRVTHVAADRLGNLYWSQESPDGQDTMFAMGPDDLPRATRLTSGNIYAAMGALPARVWSPARQTTQPVNASGQIQSLAAGADGAIYFYFSGGAGAIGREAFGRFEPRSGEIRILAATRQLAEVSGMGRSLDLARGQLIATGPLIRLLIRHSDRWVLLDFDPRRSGSAGAGTGAKADLAKTISTIRIDGRDQPVDLSRDEYDLFAGPAGLIEGADAAVLLLRDKKLGGLYSVDSGGDGKFLVSLVDLPAALSEPAIDAADKGILMFAGDGSLIDPQVFPRPNPADVQVQFPALLSVAWPDATFRAIGRDSIRGPGNFTVYSLRLQQLVPYGRRTYVGYDSASGQLLRLHLLEK